MKRILLIGDPVEHSLSPSIQNAAFKSLNIPICYEALKIPTERFEEEIHKVFHNREILGANITSPFKERILPFVCPDGLSREIGAVNTIIRKDLVGAEDKEFSLGSKQRLLRRTSGPPRNDVSKRRSQPKWGSTMPGCRWPGRRGRNTNRFCRSCAGP